MIDRRTLILGATGGNGGAVAAALLNRGTPVRAMARQPDKPAARRLADRGVDVVAGSLDDRAALFGQRIELASDAMTPRRMANALGEVLSRSVRHDQTPLESIRNPDMFAMWRFLNGPGYRVDVEALRDENPDIAWTSFADWARQSIE